MTVDCIDIFCHFLPRLFCDAALKMAVRPLHMLERASTMAIMTDSRVRADLAGLFPGYRQVISLASPQVEVIAGAERSVDLARLANDALAETVRSEPDFFAGFVAALPLLHPRQSLEEARRSIEQLGACGIQLYTNIDGKPIDSPEFRPLFEFMAERDLPVWLHPIRSMHVPDYPGEEVSKYELWWVLGWPYETSLMMARLVYSGIFEDWPDLKIVTHHAGGMIPMVAGRLGPAGMPSLGGRTPEEYKWAVQSSLKEPALDAFRRFYVDTATFGCSNAIDSAMRFFGPDKLLFASDMPFGPDNGIGNIRSTIAALERLELDGEQMERILLGNATRILGPVKSRI